MQRNVSLRDQVFELARAYFSTPNVIGLPYDDKVKELNTMISSKLVVISGVSRNELVDWFNREVGRSGFEKLGKDPFYSLLANSDPKTVLTLCKTHPQISKLCRDDQVFQNLLKLHFPDDFDIDDIPYKDQYKFLTGGGRVMPFGNGRAGQLGLGDDIIGISTPEIIPNIVGIKQASSGGNHTVLLDTDGRVWTIGLGLKNDESKNKPIPIPHLTVEIKQVSTGGFHTVLLDTEGRVWTFGNGVSGKLGLGDYADKNYPVMIPNLPVEIKQVSAGGSNTILLDVEGRVWTFGRGRYGQLGLGDNTNKYAPRLIPNLPVEIKQVSGGSNHTVLLDIDDRVWTFGDNVYGQLGLGTTVRTYSPIMIPNLVGIKQVSAGGDHTILLDVNGKVWTFGLGVNGQLGLGNTDNIITPVMISGLIVEIKQVSAGGGHTILLDTEGRVWTFGDNVNGQLGLGDYTDRYIPVMIPNLVGINRVSAGDSHTVLLTVSN